jgi:hypothetical protein
MSKALQAAVLSAVAFSLQLSSLAQGGVTTQPRIQTRLPYCIGIRRT